ncbi:hypothetical protein D1AOALGA4SA_12015 [Olavius algarvensis Delta 1 endosymbiont]|nr:hypothetical protein D1AOALGA4SA_12015 [Olavius algarvensis Delta 1 endosymbiont]
MWFHTSGSLWPENGQSDRKRNCAKFTQFSMNSLALSSSSLSSKILSRFQARGRGRVRRRARFKHPVFGVKIYVVSHERGLQLEDSRSDRERNF